MMKLKLYIISLLTVLLSTGSAEACYWEPSWGENGCYDFCIYKVEAGGENNLSKERMKERNIWLWMQQTGLSRQQVESLVYPDSQDLDDDSVVRRLLKNDSVTCRLVLLARNCELQRSRMSSAWYYPIEDDEPHIILEQIAQEAEATILQRIHKMQGRFLLQSIRARFALRQYAQCIALWNNHGSIVKDAVIKDFIEPYIAGCYYHLHRPQMAMPIYIRHGDISSLKLCCKMAVDEGENGQNYEQCDRRVESPYYPFFERLECFKLIADYCPNIPDLGSRINPYLSHVCLSEYNWDPSPEQIEQCKQSAIKAGLKSGKRNRCLWYYAAAALSDACQNRRETLRWIAEANKCEPSEQMKIYLQLLEYHSFFAHAYMDSAYDQRVGEFINWIDERMKSNFNRSHISPRVHTNYYTCFVDSDINPRNEAEFWNFALRKIVFSDICKRYEKAHSYDKMLPLANYAENRYLKLCDGAYMWFSDYWSDTQLKRLDEKFCFDNYIRPVDEWNYNYSTELYAMTDSLPAFVLNNYLIWMEQPHEGYEKILVDGSITDRSYWYEMLGTHYLREHNYVCAKNALSNVSRSFMDHMNVKFHTDPFSLEKSEHNDTRCKLRFAEEMVRLEQMIKASSFDDRAEYMLRYASGMINSAELWEMTAYEWHHDWKTPYCWKSEHFSDILVKKGKSMQDKALSLFHDRNRKAKALLQLGRRLDVMRDYADTQAAEYLVRHCDLWKDYAEKRSNSFYIPDWIRQSQLAQGVKSRFARTH